MADINTITSDPDFWHPDTTDATRSHVLSKNDKNFASADQATQAKLLEGLRKRNQEGQRIAQKEIAGAEQSQSLFNKYIAQPLNSIAGSVIEGLGSPAVPFARMAQGESPSAAFTGNVETLGAGGAAQTARNQAGSAIVPQEAWQAGLMAAGPLGRTLGRAVPAAGVLAKTGMAGSAARTGLAGLLGASGEAALGDQSQGVGKRALQGGVKAGALQGATEAISPLSSFIDRHTPGAKGRVNAEDVGRVQGAIGETVPEFKRTFKNPAQAGQFYQEGGAQKAAESAFASKVEPLDDVVSQNPTWIRSVELDKAYKMIENTYKNKPGFDRLFADIQPDPVKGFLPSQVAKILARTREALVGAGNDRVSGHMAQEAVDSILEDVVRSMPADVGRQFLAAREGFAGASSVRDVLEGSFKPGPKGYSLDMRGPQTAIADPGNTRRLPAEGATLKEALMRGKDAPPGSQDWYPGEGGYTPYLSKTGAASAGVKKLLHQPKYVGKKPLTTPVESRTKASGLAGLLTGKLTKEEEK